MTKDDLGPEPDTMRPFLTLEGGVRYGYLHEDGVVWLVRWSPGAFEKDYGMAPFARIGVISECDKGGIELMLRHLKRP